MTETHGGCQVLGITYSRSLECEVFEWKDLDCGNYRRGELGMNAPGNLQVKGLKIFEPFNPKRFLLESWPFSAFPAVGSKGLPEPSGPTTHFTDGKTEAQGQKSLQRVTRSGGWGSSSTEALASSAQCIPLEKGVFTERREEDLGEYEGLEPRGAF